MSDAYRDPLASLRSQIATKRAVTLDVERQLTPFRRMLLADELRAALEDARVRAALDADSVEGLCAIERDVDAYDEALRHAIDDTDFSRCRREGPPRPLPPAEGGTPLAGLGVLEMVVGKLAENAERWGNEAVLVSLINHRTRLDFLAEAFPTERRGIQEIGHVVLSLRGGAPRCTPFEIRPIVDVKEYQRRLGTRPHPLPLIDLAGALGLIHLDPPKVAPRKKPAFTDVFGFDGPEVLVDAALDDDVRDALLALEPECVLELPSDRRFPSLTARDGCFAISWTRMWKGEDTHLGLELGLEAMRALYRRLSIE
jgi:hypothetical protein